MIAVEPSSRPRTGAKMRFVKNSISFSPSLKWRRLSVSISRGFTILEMVIAIGILSFGVVAAMGLYMSAVRQFKDAVDTTKVALLSELALTEAKDYLEETDSPTEINWDKHDDFPGFEYKVVYTPTSLNGEYKVEVIIGWGREKPPPHLEERFEYEEHFYTILLK